MRLHVAGVLALVISLSASPVAPAGAVSLALPPFENLTGDTRLDWIGEGFSRTLTEKLNQVADLTAAPLAARGFFSAGREIDFGRLAGESSPLAADLILFGAIVKGADVDRLDDPLEVSVRIVDPQTTKQVHALEIVGTVKQLFSLESDLAIKVSSLLGVQLSPGEEQALRTPVTRSLAAYKETVLGTLFLEDGKYVQAIAMFEEAMRHNPGIFYPRAHQLLAQAYILSGRKREMLERFKKDAAALSEAYYNLAVAQEYAGDFAQARDNYGLFLKYTDRKTLLWRRTEPGSTIVDAGKDSLVLRGRDGKLSARSRDGGEPVALPAVPSAPADTGGGKTRRLVPQAVAAWLPDAEKQQLSTDVLIAGDRFYYGLQSGYVIGRSRANGNRTYAYRTAGVPRGNLAVAAGVLYVTDSRCKLYALGVVEGAGPSDVSAHLRLAELAERQQKQADAEEIYRHIVEEVKPNAPEAWHGLWKIAKASGDEAVAQRYWRGYLEAQY